MTFDGVLGILVAFDLVDETQARELNKRVRNNRVPHDLDGWISVLRPVLQRQSRQERNLRSLRDAVLADGQLAA